MAWQVTLKRKDGTIRSSPSMGGQGDPPQVGDVIDYPIDGELIKAKVTGVKPTSVGAAIGQPMYVVDAEEI